MSEVRSSAVPFFSNIVTGTNGKVYALGQDGKVYENNGQGGPWLRLSERVVDADEIAAHGNNRRRFMENTPSLPPRPPNQDHR